MILFLEQWLNAFGLALNMVGVLFIFKWGPPQPSFESGVALCLEDATPLPNGKTVAEHNASIESKKKRYKLMSCVGLIFIFVGFLCQFLNEVISKTLH